VARRGRPDRPGLAYRGRRVGAALSESDDEPDMAGRHVKQCRDANVPLFVKQDSGRNPGEQGRIPAELWVRQFPKIMA